MAVNLSRCCVSGRAGSSSGLQAKQCPSQSGPRLLPKQGKRPWRSHARSIRKVKFLKRTEGLSFPLTLPPNWTRRMPSRSEEHTSELQSLMRISYAVFCLKHKTNTKYEKRD